MNGPILVDFDFRYPYEIDARQHSIDHIIDIITVYLDEIKACLKMSDGTTFPVYVFEKPHVNRVEDKNITKDGIHIIFGIQADNAIQMIIRDNVLTKIGDCIVDLPFIQPAASTSDEPCPNVWETILDSGISEGCVNWQLYGSRKPANEAYELTSFFTTSYDESDREFILTHNDISEFDVASDFIKLSAQCTAHTKCEIHPNIMQTYNNFKQKNGGARKSVRRNHRGPANLIIYDDEDDRAEDYIPMDKITNREMLDKAMNANVLNHLRSDEYDIREVHEYTQILPAKYYEAGSHTLNRQVAFALKHTDDRLFLSWVMLRSKADDFDYSTIPSLFHDWRKYFNSNKSGLTKRSIMYWAKQYVFEDYKKVKCSTIDHYIEETIFKPTEFDIATILYQMYKDKYVCVSYDKRGVWYVFKSHRWEIDKGNTLRLAISRNLYRIMSNKQEETINELSKCEDNDDLQTYYKKKIAMILN